MNNIIARYVYQVTSKLPEDQRDDVSKELKATIEDMIASEVENGMSETDALNKILTKMGDPAKLADKYLNTKQYLIGPKWFSIYKNLLIKILKYNAVIIFLVLLGVGLEKGGSASSIVKEAIFTTANILIHIVFWTTLVFAYVDRNDLDIPELKEKPWTPDQLPKEFAKRQVSIVDAVAEVIGSLFTIGLIVYSFAVPVFNQSLWLPLGITIIVVAFIELVHQLFILKVGNWTMPLWISGITLNILMLLLAIIFVSIPDLISPILIANLESHGINNATQMIDVSIQSTILAIILTYLWQIYTSTKFYFEYKNRVKFDSTK